MAIKFLQIINPPILPVLAFNVDNECFPIENNPICCIQNVNHLKYNNCNLLELFLQFFDFFTRFDFQLLQISIIRPGLEIRKNLNFEILRDNCRMVGFYFDCLFFLE